MAGPCVPAEHAALATSTPGTTRLPRRSAPASRTVARAARRTLADRCSASWSSSLPSPPGFLTALLRPSRSCGPSGRTAGLSRLGKRPRSGLALTGPSADWNRRAARRTPRDHVNAVGVTVCLLLGHPGPCSRRPPRGRGPSMARQRRAHGPRPGKADAPAHRAGT
jgi:hypothetical protein